MKMNGWRRLLAVCLCMAVMGLGAPLSPSALAETPNLGAPPIAAEASNLSTPECPVAEVSEALPAPEAPVISEVMANDAPNEVNEAIPDPGPMRTEDFTPQEPWIVELQNEAERALRESGALEDAVQTNATRLTLEQLRAKFPAGKYWNHADRPGNINAEMYADYWTNTPCPYNHTATLNTSQQTCNMFISQRYYIGYQCHGYALKAGYDTTGKDPMTWEKQTNSSYLSQLKAGDIVRFLNDGHTIYVIDVDGEKVWYTDCNGGEPCIINWDQYTTKSTLAATFSYVLVCPTNTGVDDEYCHCSQIGAGDYIATSNAPLYARHTENSDTVGYIPAGTQVYISMLSTTLCHVSYDGVEGYSDPSCFRKINISGARITAQPSHLNMVLPDAATKTVTIQLSGKLPDWYYVGVEGSNYHYSVSYSGWENSTSCDFEITCYEVGESTFTFTLYDADTFEPVAECEVFCSVTDNSSAQSPKLVASSNRLTLNAANQYTQTITLSAKGELPGPYRFTVVSCEPEICRYDWVGDWHDESYDLKLTGMYSGETVLTLGLVCNDRMIAQTDVQISVASDTRIESSASSVELNLPGQAEKIITLRFSGLFPHSSSLNYSEDTDPTAIDISIFKNWYEKDGLWNIDVKIEGLSAGAGTILFEVKDWETGAAAASTSLPVKVTDQASQQPTEPQQPEQGPRLVSSVGSVTLNEANQYTQTITLSPSGDIFDEYFFSIEGLTSDVCKYGWVGDWHDGSHDLKLTGTRPGTATLTVGLNTDDGLIATTDVAIAVRGETRLIASTSKVELGVPDQAETSVILMARGMVPSNVRFSLRENTRPEVLSAIFFGDPYNRDGALATDVELIALSPGSGSLSFELRDMSTDEVMATLSLPYTVNQQESAPEVRSIYLSPAGPASLAVKKTLQLKAYNFFNDEIPAKLVNWYSQDKAVATVSGGKVKAVAVGTTEITAEYSGQSARIAITVFDPSAPTDMAFNQMSASVAVKKTLNLTKLLRLTPSTAKAKSLSWSSSDPSVATVKAGKVKGIARGTAVITARLPGLPDASIEVEVFDPKAPTALAFENDSASVAVKKSVDLGKIIRIVPSTVKASKLNWHSSDPSVATVKGGKVKGVKAGAATITAGYPGLTDVSMTVTVYDPNAPTALEFGQSAASVAVKKSLDLMKLLNYAPSTVKAKNLDWHSDRPDIATVKTGKVKGVHAGTATITVSYGSLKSSIQITVD